MSVRKITLALAALAFATACNDDGLSPGEAAIIQFVNASATSTGAVTGTAASGAVGGNVAFQSGSSTCQLVSPGSTIGFAENGTSVGSSSVITTAGQRYTAVLYGSGTTRGVLVVPEVSGTIAAGNYGLRIINATSQTGNIYVTTPTGAASGTATSTLTAGTSTGGSTGTNGFLGTPTANTRVRFFGGASTSVPLADFTVPTANATAGLSSTLIFTNAVGGGVQAFLVTPCDVDD
jgi:hypothetical protein